MFARGSLARLTITAKILYCIVFIREFSGTGENRDRGWFDNLFSIARNASTIWEFINKRTWKRFYRNMDCRGCHNWLEYMPHNLSNAVNNSLRFGKYSVHIISNGSGHQEMCFDSDDQRYVLKHCEFKCYFAHVKTYAAIKLRTTFSNSTLQKPAVCL